MIMRKDNSHNKKVFNSWSFGKNNYQLFGIGIICILLGYILMITGETQSVQSTKVAPIVLTIAYCVIIPISILYKK